MIEFDKYRKRGAYHWKLWKERHPRYSKHAAFIASWIKERPCLDVGCGDGLITHLLGPGTDGIDLCDEAVGFALDHKVKARVFDVYLLDAVEQYAAVYLGDIIEHLEYPPAALDRVRRALRPGGFLYISTPPKHDKLHDRYHLREYSPSELQHIVESAGFKLTDEIQVREDWVQMYGRFQKSA